MRICLDRSFHFNKSNPCYMPAHGPQDWQERPFWKFISFLVCKLSVHPPSIGKRLWIYTRWGSAHFDIVFDRRTL